MILLGNPLSLTNLQSGGITSYVIRNQDAIMQVSNQPNGVYMSHLTLVSSKKPINAIELVASGVESEASLKKKYQQEYNSWRSRRLWAKQHNIPFHPDWNVFSVFLEYVGLAPTKEHTIDRIVNKLGYVPNNIRWASKQTQSENRDNVIWLEYGGKKKTLTAWAKDTYQNKSTLLKRHKAGWDTKGIITGVKPDFILPEFRIPRDHPWPEAFKRQWETKYRDSKTPKLRINFLTSEIDRVLKDISTQESFLFDSYYPDDPDIDYETPIEITERLKKLNSKRKLYLSFRNHAKRWIQNYNRFMNSDIG